MLLIAIIQDFYDIAGIRAINVKTVSNSPGMSIPQIVKMTSTTVSSIN